MLLLPLALAGATLLSPQSTPRELPPVPGPVQAALAAGDGERALEAIATLEDTDPDQADLWAFLRGKALEVADRDAEAADEWARFAEGFPASPWRYQALFGRAELLRELRDFEAAQAIYEAGLLELRAEGRRRELASAQLEVADALSRPRDRASLAARDLPRALELYTGSLELDLPADLREHALFQRARCQAELGDPAAAGRLWSEYLGAYDDPATTRPRERRPEALLGLGRALVAQGRAADGRRRLEELETRITASLAGAEGGGLATGNETRRSELEELAGVAAYEAARTWVDAGGDGALLGVARLRRFLEDDPDHRLAADAAQGIAASLRALGRADEALEAYEVLLALPLPGGDARPEDRERAARLQQRALVDKGLLLREQGRLGEAIGVFTTYTRAHPSGPDWSEAQRQILEAEYALGAQLEGEGRLAEARAAWTGFLERHPLDGRAPGILYDLGRLFRDEGLLAQEAGDPSSASSLLRQAIGRWERLAEKHPGTEEASRGLFEAGYLRETRLDELLEAIETYRRCTFGSWAVEARERLLDMTGETLEVVTERAFHSDEAVRVQVSLRNVESLEVALHRLDLEAYFRKHLTHERVEELDLDLITPDRSFRHEVEDYRDHAWIERELELPVEGPGAWVVSLSTETQRATTLVLRSDLHLIAKSSRQQVFVHALDPRAEEPAAGVRVLVALPPGEAQDAPTFVELTTDAQGVAVHEAGAPIPQGEVAVLALRGDHVASTGVDLDGLSTTEAPAPRRLVYTSRPAYRPGDEVHWRAVLRDLPEAEGAPRVEVTVRDPQGQRVLAAPATPGRFGTVHGSLRLDPLAPTGEYTVAVRDERGTTSEARFRVERYRLETIELSVEFERAVYFRGEELVARVSARHYYGAPVADTPLTAALPDGTRRQLRTDAGGMAELRFPAPDRVDEAALGLRVTLDPLGLSASARTYLALRAFRAELDLERELVLAGDRFSLSARTRTPDGEPVGRELGLTALRHVSEGGRTVLRRVSERRLLTDPENGEGVASLALEDGGWYTLRLEGLDRFGNPVTAERQLFVSGDGDETRLRVLSDADVARVGEALVVDIHNRTGAGLALVTLEGERVLDHRVVRLAEGHNRLELPIAARHYPNLVVAAAAVRPGAFHAAAADFDVERDLRVALAPAREEYAPGEEATVELRVTDSLGNPVEAELSLAVVDEALFAVFPDRTPRLREVFALPRRRWAALATRSSSPFEYRGWTQEISAEVLAEARRLEAQERWMGRRSRALEDLEELELGLAMDSDDFFLGQPGAPVEEEVFEGFEGVIGLGGGAGGRMGGRFGGRSSLRAQGGLAGPPPSVDSDDAFWTPAVVTDAAGRATVRFVLPDRSTRWRLTSRGISEGDSAGEATAHLVTRAAFFVELDAPAALTEGDRPGLLVRVHDAEGRGEAELTLELRQGERTETRKQRVVLDGEVVEVGFLPLSELTGREPAELSVRCVVERDGRRLEDRDAATIPVNPFGVEVARSASGDLATAETVELELEGVDAEGRLLEVHVGPRLSLELVHAALDGGPLTLRAGCTTLEADAASDLLGVAGVLERLVQEGLAGAPLASLVRARGRTLAGRLVATQRADGGWAWSAGGEDSHLPTSCRATEALARAGQLGLVVETSSLDRARAFLSGRYSGLAVSEDELKAMVVHALAASGPADFAAANRLHRLRESLSPAGLIHTTRALARMDRAAMAREVAAVLVRRADEPGRWSPASNLPWNRSELELQGQALLALIEAGGDAPLAARLAEGLEAAAPWYPARARGVVIDALARHEGGWSWDGQRARVTVEVDGAPLGTVEVGGVERGALLRLPLPADAPSPTRIAFTVAGGSAPRYTARLTGLSREFDRATTPELRVWPVPRQRAAAPVLDGRSLPTGFGVVEGLDDEERWVNTVSQIARGERLVNEVSFGPSVARRASRDPGDHLVLEVPLPAGAVLLEGSLRGAPAGTEVRDGRLLAPYGPLSSGRSLRYTLVATRPGSYRVGPAVLRSLYRPERIAIGRPSELTILAAGAASTDDYRPTPDELYHRGIALEDAGRDEEARTVLKQLHGEWGSRLREEPLRATAERLLFLSIRAGEATDTVRFFEVLREKNPELVVPVEEVLAVGRAYRELGEFERALLVFRAVLEESFGRDLKVAGALEQQGEFLRSVAVLERLWLEYPESTSTRAASLGYAEKLLAKAPVAHEDPGLRRAGVDRATLTVQGILALQRFLALYADDPLAPEAALGLVSAWLELEDHERVATFAEEMAARHEEPRFVDAFRYSSAVARWYLGQDGAAEDLLEAVAGSTYLDPSGVRRASENRELSLYILAQIAHARREFERALERYEEVEDEFSDARELLQEFRARRLELPEVTEAAVGESARLELAHAGVEELRVLAYRVDLMTLYLREKNLREVASVDLAGISPSFELATRVEPALGPEHRTAELTLDLPEPGAYLVLCTGGGLHASGLVLVSDLELRVSEDATSGRVRVTAVERDDDAYCPEVDVRVIGSDSGRFVRGVTDRRGLFIADGLAGVTTVIARRGEAEYAFHRGSRSLVTADRGRERDAAGLPLMEGATEYFKNIRTFNEDNVLGRTQQLQEEIQRKRKGVQVQQVR